MGVTYDLVNFSKKERVTFAHIGAWKARELTGDPVSAAITSWYLLNNLGDHISFVPDTYAAWPFSEAMPDEVSQFPDVTDQVVSSLIDAGILADYGKEILFEDEPELYIRNLRNIWSPQCVQGWLARIGVTDHEKLSSDQEG